MNSLWHSSAEGYSNDKPGLKSLSPSSLFSVLDLSKPEMADVRKALERKGHNAALTALLSYYRSRYFKPSDLPGNKVRGTEVRTFERADNWGKHIFQWGPYPAASYGTDIDWAADPVRDIEWVASMYRFFWASDLNRA